MNSSVKLFGISNCDTIKKAKTWLKDQAIDFEFHDYRKQGLQEDQLRDWIGHLGWEPMVNRRGTSWRKLPEEVKQAIDQETAIRIMLDNPSIIKRPLLIKQGQLYLGFDNAQYQQIFS
jgi:arsenate reductase